MKRLIVTADDLGLTKSVNDGIVDACKDGIVTAVSIIPTGEAFTHALGLIDSLPFKDVGAHLSLSETKPILPASKYYKNHNEFFFDMLFGGIDLDGVYSELKAQMEILKNAGLKITHINSHEHIHMIPKILDIIIRIAKEYNVPAVRFPRGDRPARPMSFGENYRKTVLDHFTSPMERALSGSELAYTDYFFGFLDAGCLDIDKIKRVIKALKEGVSELVTHPGFLSPEVLGRYSWHIGGETELFALTDKSVRTAIEDSGVKLIGYREFGEMN